MYSGKLLLLILFSGDMFTEEQNELIESAAEMLYGLIHVRYILTTKGMAAMVKFWGVFVQFNMLALHNTSSFFRMNFSVGQVQEL